MRPLLSLLFVALNMVPACASPISFNIWYEFSSFDVGTPAMGCFPNDPAAPECIPSSSTPTIFAGAPPWTFTVADTAALTVTDAFSHGDAFQVFDFSKSIGLTTPAATADDVSCGDDPVLCLADPLSSKATFSLGAGTHSITITPYASPYGGGTAYFIASTASTAPIPEPGTFLLVGGGLITAALNHLCRPRSSLLGP